MSRSTVNQTTAKASLTQMLNCVFQRMELNSEVVHVQPIAVVDMLGLPSTEIDTTFVQNFLHEVHPCTSDAALHGWSLPILEASFLGARAHLCHRTRHAVGCMTLFL